jgi:hypothetical protein
MRVVASVALSTALLAVAPHVSRADSRSDAAPEAAARSAKRSASPERARRAASLRQFTGYVTAVDHASLTIEKRGKNPQSRVFMKHDEMRAAGDIEKDARVTVFYREEGGKAIAHRVVARPERTAKRTQ